MAKMTHNGISPHGKVQSCRQKCGRMPEATLRTEIFASVPKRCRLAVYSHFSCTLGEFFPYEGDMLQHPFWNPTLGVFFLEKLAFTR